MAKFETRFPPLPAYHDEHFHFAVMNEGFNEADYEAVMSSRESLRAWSDSDWPEDSFTLEKNLKDLRAHIADHQNGIAYAYSIFTADRSSCLGSAYIKPIASITEHWHALDKDVHAVESCIARVDFWIRDSAVAENKEALFVRTLNQLSRKRWGGPVAFASRGDMVKRRAVYERCGLKELACLNSLTTDSRLFLHGLV